jgi:hypothetical protein
VCALAPKQLWNFADYRSQKERPILSYLISGACTLTITLPISFGFFLLREHVPIDGVQPILPFAAQAKWLLLPTVLSIALAFACDDTIEADHELWWLRWVESAGLAALMGLSGFLVMRWLSVNQPTVQHLLLIPILLNASIGVLFGATIPYWYRKTMRGTGPDAVTKPVLRSADKIAPAV